VREPIVIRAGAGEVIGDSAGRRVELLAEDDAMHATCTRLGPRREGTDLHVHRRHTDVFYVLAGELTVRLGPAGDPVAAPAGTLVRVPPLVVHAYRNRGDADVRFVNVHAPGRGFAAYLRALRDGRPHDFDQEPPPDDGGRPPAEASVGAGHEPVARDGARVRLLADAEELGVAQVERVAGAPPAPAHVHRRHTEALYALDGELTVTVAGRPLRLDAGAWLTVPAGAPHAVWSPGPARFLEIHAPGGGYGAFVRGEQTAFDQQPAGW